jgi:D-glycero-alpha-D-manno-heptose-7-phosphate kinase
MSTSTSTFLPDVFPNHKDPAAVIIRAKTPVRISFAGGGTDFPHWFESRQGAVLCSTITH